MVEKPLLGRRVLVVEDEYLVADALAAGLAHAGAIIVGMAGTVEDAMRAIDAAGAFDGAILDLNVGGEMTFDVADRLARDGIPFLFATGYDASVIPLRFATVRRCEKPVSIHRLVSALVDLIGRRDDSAREG